MTKASLTQASLTSLKNSLFNKAAFAVAVVDSDSRFVDVNPAFADFMGFTKQELIGRTIADITHPDDLKITAKAVGELRRGKRNSVDRFEKRYIHKSGKILWGEVTAYAVECGPRKDKYTVAQIVDITARKEAEASRQLMAMRYSKLYESMRDAFVIVSMDGLLQDCNRVYLDMLGYTREELMSLTYLDLTPAKWHDREAQIVKNQVLTRGYSDVYEKEYRCKDGRIIPIELRTVLMRNGEGKPTAMWAMVRNIEDRRRTENKLRNLRDTLELKVRERTRRLRKLAGELSLAEHKERRRIANVLHEDLQQRLVAMKYQVHDLEKNGLKNDASATIRRVLAELDEAIHLTRTLSSGLCPPVLYELGLKPALEWLALDLKTRLGLSVAIESEKGVDITGDDLRVFAYEAVRGLLLNVAKHAGVGDVLVQVKQSGVHSVRISVTDKGIGFDPQKELDSRKKLGLFSIQERTRSFGGRFDVVSAPGRGARVIMTLPRK